MINVPKALRDWLLTKDALTAHTSTRIWAEAAVPPAGYSPSDGVGLAFRVRGGDQVGEQRSALLQPSVQVAIYGPSESAIHAAYRALYDTLDAPPYGWPVRNAELESLGQTLTDPARGWPFVLTFYRLTFANT